MDERVVGCSQCVFWRRLPESAEDHRKAAPRGGECHRHAPRPGDAGYDGEVAWPLTAYVDFCGDGVVDAEVRAAGDVEAELRQAALDSRGLP